MTRELVNRIKNNADIARVGNPKILINVCISTL